MKFLLKFKDNSLVFVDPNDEQKYLRFVKLLKAHHPDGLFELDIEIYKNKITEQQHKLIKTLISIIAKETGNDTETIYQSFYKFQNDKSFDDMNNEDLEEYLSKAFIFSIEFFGLNFSYDPNTYFIITSR